MKTILTTFVFGLFIAENAMAKFTYEGHLTDPSDTALSNQSTFIRVGVVGPASACVLFLEEHTVLTDNKGFFSIQVGSGTDIDGLASTLDGVFSNSSVMTGMSSCTYTPAAGDGRRLKVDVYNGTSYEALGFVALGKSPQAAHADNANKLDGINANQYTKFSDITTAGCVAGQALRYNGTVFVCETIAGAGVVATGTTSGYLASSDWSVFNNKLSNFSTLISTDITTALGYTPLSAGGTSLSGDVTGTVSSTVVATVGGKTAANISTSVAATIGATNLNTASTLVKRNASGDFTAGTISATTFSGANASATYVSTQNVLLFDNTNTNRIIFKAPVAGITNYTLTLPPAVGTNGQVLTTNSIGELAWVSAIAGSVGSVTATAPLVSSGGASPDISLAKASATVNGYLASSDFTMFSNKLTNTLASANMFVGSAGNLATAVIPSGDVSSVSNTGVFTFANTIGAGGTSSKVTYDTKGRIIAVASLTSADITGPLGYVPTTNILAAGQALIGNGSNIAVGRSILLADVRSSAIAGPAFNMTGGCSPGNTVTYTSVNDNFTCQPFGLTNGQVLSALGYSPLAAGGPLLLPLGLVTSPTYSFSGDSSTGIYSPGPGELAFSTFSIDRMRILGSGKIGIGTASPDSELSVFGAMRATTISGSHYDNTTASTIDLVKGNLITSTFTCVGSVSLVNLRDGGTYKIVMKDTGTTQCSFNTAVTGLDSGTMTFKFNPANAARNTSVDTIYELSRFGSTVYVKWAAY